MSRNFQTVAAAVLVVIILVTILPWFLPPSVTSTPLTCINTLRQIDGATHQWALVNGKSTNDTPTWEDLLPYLDRKRKPYCHSGGKYTLAPSGQVPACSYPGHSLPTSPPPESR
jgi:hypothetical protein